MLPRVQDEGVNKQREAKTLPIYTVQIAGLAFDR